VALDCDALPVQSDRIDLCIEPPGEDDRFPSDDGVDGDSNGDRHHLLRPPSQGDGDERSEWTGARRLPRFRVAMLGLLHLAIVRTGAHLNFVS
jgi:hypothetical protein